MKNTYEMKGKNTFTRSEIKELEQLIILRNKTASSGQKAIRQKMRNIGFYGKDDWGIIDLISLKNYRINPKVIVFVYKAVLDKIIMLNFKLKTKSNYGFNSLLDKYFNSRVFVFPMPETPCKSEEATKSMTELQQLLNK